MVQSRNGSLVVSRLRTNRIETTLHQGITHENESPISESVNRDYVHLANPRTMSIGAPQLPSSSLRGGFMERHSPAGLQVKLIH